MSTRRVLATWATPLVLAAAGFVHANQVYSVSLNTVALGVGNYAIAFSLQDGSALDDHNNTVTLSHFDFGGGSAAGSPVLGGGASGSLGTSVVISDSAFSSFFVEGFTPGATLSFNLDLTTNVDAGAVPDFFGFSLLLDGVPLPTLDDTLGDNLLYLNFDSGSPTVVTWATSDLSPVALNAPTVGPATPPNGNVAEPATSLLLIAAAASLMHASRRRRHAPGTAVATGP